MAENVAVPHVVTKPPPWHTSVVADLMLSSVSAGIFLICALGDLCSPATFASVLPVGFVAAFILILTDLASLVVDLGDPSRFHHMLRTFKLSSPMSVGVWIISLFAMLSFVRASLAIIALPAAAGFGTLVDVLGIGAALFVGAYKGVLLSTTAQPGWRDARWLGAQLSVSSGALGTAATILIALALPAAACESILRASLAAFLMLELVLASVTAVEMRAARPTFTNALFRRYPPRLGLFVALLIAIASSSQSALACAALVTLINALALRRDLIMLPHEAV